MALKFNTQPTDPPQRRGWRLRLSSSVGIGTGCILAGFASLLMRRDYNGVRIFGIWLRLCSLWISANRMGGLTANHFPGRRRRRFRTAAYRGIKASDAH